MRSKTELQSAIRGAGRAVLMINVRSRRGRRLQATARRLLDQAGLEFAEYFPVTEPDGLSELFGKVLAMRPDLVVVGGGDGTIAEAVGHLAHQDIALGLIPLGTTNNFARSLELPLSLEGAVGVLRDGKVADVDVGRFDGTPLDGATRHDLVRGGEGPQSKHIFANMVSVGLAVNVAEQVPPDLKRVIGRAAYGVTAARLLPRHEAFQATIRIGDETFELDTHQLNVANGAHHSGQRIARDASPDDRLLAVYRLGDHRRIRLASATARHMLTGSRRTLAEDAFITTDHVHIATDPPLSAEVDGEIRGQTPMTIGLLGNALRVIVQQSFVDT